jgi:hypothetical protein
VILLENSNEWNLSPAKRRILEKKEKKRKRKRSKVWKAKEVKPHMKSSMYKKERRKRGWNLQAARRDSIERKQERRSHFPIVQNPICGLIHTHISFAFALSSIP